MAEEIKPQELKKRIQEQTKRLRTVLEVARKLKGIKPSTTPKPGRTKT